MAVELPELLVRNASEWRAWLAANHDREPGVWLVLHKKGGDVTELDYETAVLEALCFGWIDGQQRSRDAGSSALRFTPRTKRSRWSLSNVERVARLEAEGRMTPAGRTAVDTAKADGRWQAAQGTTEVRDRAPSFAHCAALRRPHHTAVLARVFPR